MNILQGDCLTLLPNIPAESVQMIYIDPPFFTQKNHSLKTRDNQTEYREQFALDLLSTGWSFWQ
jgi:site-specific DNA-methyltransferase (adenine-specific)